MSIPPWFRLHSNGMVAFVTQSGDGRFMASAHVSDKHDVVTSDPVATDIASLEEAQRIADRYAHATCTEACAEWRAAH